MTDQRPVLQRPAGTAAERRAILDEYDSYPRGDVRRGALLRHHGVYTSQIAQWRQRLACGEVTLDARAPGPKPQPHHPRADEVVQLRRENARLPIQLVQAQTIIDVQKKGALLLNLTLLATNEHA